MIDPERAREIIRAQAEAWESGDADAIAAPFASPCEFITPGTRLVTPGEIRDAALRHFRSHEGIRVTIHETVVEGDLAAVEWRWEDRDRQTGQNNRAGDAIIVRFRDGKIVYWREYIDRYG